MNPWQGATDSSNLFSFVSESVAGWHRFTKSLDLATDSIEIGNDVFKRFKDNNGEGEFKGEINSDVEGLLSLFEASYLGFEDENVLEEARKFSKTHLIKNLFKQGANNITNKVTHALELPYHRRVHRLEARWFIQNFQEKQPQDRVLLQLAKLDFNIVQSLMKKELQEILRWWMEIGLSKKMDFARDRLMEVYFWAIGMVPDPQLSHCRKFVTKMFGLVTIIDDVYDVYATLPELQLFTHAVQSWDVNAVNTLPDYMKLIFLALFNSVNDMAYITLRENGHNCLPHLAKSWCELCKAFLQEATWCNNKIIPPFDAYLQNASISSSGGALLAPCYFLLARSQPAAMDDSITSNYLVHSSCTIFRLYNDLATSTAEVERGETTNSIVSYMNENNNGKCEEHEAREKLKELIEKEWKKMNGECARVTLLPAAFKEIAINMARVSQCTYQYGDALGRPDDSARNRINLLLLQPIPIT
ncbi:hypothetical protein PIB30_017871 [Stylosanthes scabra]|uniref:Terpene synthase metal-binding domain-containing protein n=1 Tax=Stylosanthes scabra TaxID=79078 RepID=A0ABU6X5A2_9FABA|nr:hypothetical protein [Stylosanthes scabra]